MDLVLFIIIYLLYQVTVLANNNADQCNVIRFIAIMDNGIDNVLLMSFVLKWNSYWEPCT